MSRISDRFAQLKARGEQAFIAYVCAGDPNLQASYEIVRALAKAGTDVIELGLPYSDPLADGPTIQAGTQRALKAGTTADKTLDLVRRLRADGLETPLCIMTYYNVFLRRGLDVFCTDAKAAGVDGLIIPDLPLEESGQIQQAAQKAGLDLVVFVAPTSTPERIGRAAKAASGFLYAVSVTGVTGERAKLNLDRIQGLVEAAQAAADTPVCVGFGISTPEQVRSVCQLADGAIVGSALVKLCGEGGSPAEIAARVGALAGELKAATRPA